MMKIKTLLENNRAWALSVKRKDPGFFLKLSRLQRPQFLWVGCSDSRVPANEITGLLPGELFVHRNVANIVYADDLNCLSVLHYAIEVLKVRHVIICGHYGCGGVKAVIESKRLGEADAWLRSIRDTVRHNLAELKAIKGKSRRADRLCELHVLQQARTACAIPFVRRALETGRLRGVHAWIYDLRDGRIRELRTYCYQNGENNETMV